MKYNAYIVQLKHRENSLTASLVLSDGTISANFKKIGRDLFIANLKTQVEFRFLQIIPLKSKNKNAIVLQPVTSSYNKRKLTKIARFLEVDDVNALNTNNFLHHLLTIEKILRVQELLVFFSLTREDVVPMLLNEEIQEKIKIIDFTYLTITSYDTIRSYQDELKAFFTDCYTSRKKSLKIVDIENHIKLPHTSILFKYLLHRLRDHFDYRIMKDKILFKKLSLSDEEKDSIEDVEQAIRDSKLSIFTMDNIVNTSGDLVYKDVNASFWFMVDNGQLVQLSEKFFMFTEDINKIINRLKKFKRNEGDLIDIQSFRELTNYSRKFIIILFEYFDAQQITERVENKRKILLGI